MDGAIGDDVAAVGAGLDGWDVIRYRTVWVCEKWSEEAVDFARRKLHLPKIAEVSSAMFREILGIPAEIEETILGNMLLNEGIQEIWDLAIAAGGTTAYNNANAEIGVGDSATAEVATQTDLQAATNKLFKAMNATYPQRTNQTVAWQSDFTTAEANYAWAEWGIRNGVTRNRNMNRKVQALGTKASGTWTLTASITLS
jgi:hypothetical protein